MDDDVAPALKTNEYMLGLFAIRSKVTWKLGLATPLIAKTSFKTLRMHSSLMWVLNLVDTDAADDNDCW